MKKLLIASVLSAAATCSFGAGFGIYEASARGNAMGGALIGGAGDATANYYNPADLAFSTNIQVAVGLTYINPYCDDEVDHEPQNRMNPGWFAVPSFYLSVPLPADFTLGWGNYTEFGLGTRYGKHWDLAGDTQKTTMRQVTLNPNLAYKVTDWWSVSAGLRGSWIQFINHKEPYHGTDLTVDANGMGTLTAHDPYDLHAKLKGDDWGYGWNAGTEVKPHKDVSIGLLYRSEIRHKIKGNFDLKGDVAGTASGTINHPLYGPIPYSTAVSRHYKVHTDASAKLRLPQSVAMGVNWNVTDRYRVGTAVTWTQWSRVRTINFRIPEYGYKQDLKWRDTWRVSLGMEYDLFDWLSVRGGYTFDEDPTRKSHSTTMLPCGDRHIIGSGLGFKLADNLFLDLGYSFIRMNNEHYNVPVKDSNGNLHNRRFSTHNGYSHLVSMSLRYSF